MKKKLATVILGTTVAVGGVAAYGLMGGPDDVKPLTGEVQEQDVPKYNKSPEGVAKPIDEKETESKKEKESLKDGSESKKEKSTKDEVKTADVKKESTKELSLKEKGSKQEDSGKYKVKNENTDSKETHKVFKETKVESNKTSGTSEKESSTNKTETTEKEETPGKKEEQEKEKVVVEVEKLELKMPFKTVKEEDPAMDFGRTVVKQEGQQGLKEVTYEVTYKNGKRVGSKKIDTTVLTEPVDKVILVGTKDVIETKTEVSEVLIPYKTIKKEDNTLDYGKTVVSQEGKNGWETVTTEVTFTNGKETERKEVSREVTEDAVNEVILVGTKDVIKVEQEDDVTVIPFKTKVKEDPTLDKGKTKVETKGVNGKKVVTYEVTYTNGKETDRKEVNVDVTKPVDEVILKGTKVTEVKTENAETVIKYNTVEKEDPTLEVGKTKVQQKGKNGKVEYTYDVTYVNGKETGRKLVDKKVTEAVDEVILVGTMVVTYENDVVKEDVPFKVEEKEDDTMLKGTKKVIQEGKKGIEEVTYKVRYENGKEVSRKEVERITTEEPLNEIVLVGTKEVKVETETKEETIKYNVVEKEDPTLEKGKTKVEQKGKNGKKVKTYEVTYTNGKETDRVFVKEETVLEPVDEVILVGTMVVEYKEEVETNTLKYNVIEKEDDTLDKGKTKVQRKGKNGKEVVTYKVRYENGKKVGREELNREVTEPVDEILLVGTKVTEVKVEEEVTNIPFKTVEQKDDTLDKGKTKVKQQGVAGKKTVKYEVTYVNGKVTDKKELSTDVTEPVDEIILVGNKDVITYKNEVKEEVIPYETVKQNDPTLDKGKTKVKQQGKNGKKVKTYKVKYVNGEKTDVATLESEEVIEPVKEIILVGTKDVITTKTETVENEIDFKTVEQNDPTLPKGTTKVKQKGKKGLEVVTIEVTITNGKETGRKEISRVVEVEPVNEIVLVGTKDIITTETTTVTNEVPFQKRTEEDPTLPKGETKIKQVGKNGKEVVTYEVTYTNGEETGRKEISREVTEAAVDEITLVGTKEVVDVAQFESEVVRLVNIERAKVGLEPLKVDPRAAKIARDNSNRMASNGQIDHSSGFASKLSKAGIEYRGVGENVAEYHSTPEEVMKKWMGSTGHRENILREEFTHFGVGYAEKGNFWTQVFYQESLPMEIEIPEIVNNTTTNVKEQSVEVQKEEKKQEVVEVKQPEVVQEKKVEPVQQEVVKEEPKKDEPKQEEQPKVEEVEQQEAVVEEQVEVE